MTTRCPASSAVAIVLSLSLAACGNQDYLSARPLEVTTKSGVEMILVPGGEFMMGSTNGADDESPRHKVTITGFAMDKFEVTQDQYAAFELPNPSHFKDPKRPVEQIRWSDAALFCNERSRREGLDPCYNELTFECNFEANGYRLPTEAEWEYAARAGTYSFFRKRKSKQKETSFGKRKSKQKETGKLGSYACFAGNSTKKTDLVGRKRPNRWGFHDMYGNVLEWCNDVYSPIYYSESPDKDPRGPAKGQKRVMRGGAWNSSVTACRAAPRFAEAPGIADACFARDTFGFRCVRRLAPEELERLQRAASGGPMAQQSG